MIHVNQFPPGWAYAPQPSSESGEMAPRSSSGDEMTLAEELVKKYGLYWEGDPTDGLAAIDDCLERAAQECETSHKGKPCWSCADRIRALKSPRLDTK